MSGCYNTPTALQTCSQTRFVTPFPTWYFGPATRQVYFVVALFRATQPRVMEAASRGLDLWPLLAGGEAAEGFDLEEAILFMEGLEKRHRSRCLDATRAYLAQ